MARQKMVCGVLATVASSQYGHGRALIMATARAFPQASEYVQHVAGGVVMAHASGESEGRTRATGPEVLCRVQDGVGARSPRARACRGMALGTHVLATSVRLFA